MKKKACQDFSAMIYDSVIVTDVLHVSLTL